MTMPLNDVSAATGSAASGIAGTQGDSIASTSDSPVRSTPLSFPR